MSNYHILDTHENPAHLKVGGKVNGKVKGKRRGWLVAR